MTRTSFEADGPCDERVERRAPRATTALVDDTDDDTDDTDDEELLSLGFAHASRDATSIVSPLKRAREEAEMTREDNSRVVRSRALEDGERAKGVVDVIDLVDTDDDDDDNENRGVSERVENGPRPPAPYAEEARRILAQELADIRAAAAASGRVSQRAENGPRPPAPYAEEARRILAQELADTRAAAAARALANRPSTSAGHAPRVGSAKMMFSEITAVLDESLNTDAGYGKAVKNAFEAGSTDGKSFAIMHVFENLPLKSSITWRYHHPSSEAVGRVDGARSAEYTAVLMNAQEFVELLENDHAKFHVMVKDFRRVNRELNHKLCIVVNGFHDYCVQRERKEAYKGLAAFRQRDFDFSLATIFAQYQNVVLVNLPRMVSSIDHVVALHKNLAAVRYEPPKTLLDIVGGKTTARFDDGLSRGAGYGERRKSKTSADIFFAALLKIPGVSESVARAIVCQYGSMMDLMDIYADPTSNESYKKALLADILSVASNGTGQPRRIGPIVSERVYNIFRAWPSNDTGGAIFARR